VRLLAIAVEHFRCIREASVTFGPGLNVLYGPNDLGKSSLAEAIRAALLLLSTSGEGKNFVPAGTDNAPKVVLTFEAEEGAGQWRITKTFGARGAAVLESSPDGMKWKNVASGRDVDGRVRGLLAWGIPSPGGKGAQHGMGNAFLTTALLGRQGEVDAILAANIEDDKDPSGREIVTRALNVLGQDPLVQSLLARLEEKTEEVFTAKGKQRRTADSPLMRLKKDIEQREEHLKVLEEAALRSAEVQAAIRDCMAERERIAADRDAAAAVVDAAGEGLAFAEQRAAAVKALDAARGQRDRILAVQRSIGEAQTGLAVTEAAFAEALERARAATAAMTDREDELSAARQKVEAARIARGEASSSAEHADERRSSELRSKEAAAQARAETAHKANKLQERALSLRRELADAEARLEESKRLESRASQRFRLAGLRAELRAATEALDAAQEAGTKREWSATAFETASLEHTAAEARVEAARRDVDSAREEVTRGRAAASVEDARRQSLLTNLMQVEASERDSLGLVERAQAAVRRGDRILKLEEALSVVSARAAAAEGQLAEGSAAVESAEKEQRALAAVALWRRVEEVSRRAKTLVSPAGVAQLRTRAAQARARAVDLAASAPAMLTAERLAAANAVDERRRNLRQTPQPHAPAISLPLCALVALGSGAGVAPLLYALTGLGATAIATAAALAALVAGALCFMMIRLKNEGRAAQVRSALQADRDYVERRWDDECAPLLRAAGAADVVELAQRFHAADASRLEAANLRQEADRLESQVRLAERDVESLSSLEWEEVSLRKQLRDFQLPALAARASTFEPAASGALEHAIQTAEAAVNGSKRSREQSLDERSRALSQLESARALLEAARAERDLHAGSLNSDPRAVLDEAGQRVQAARDRAAELRRLLASLAPAMSAPAAPAYLQTTEKALTTATSDLKSKATARDQASREQVQAEAENDQCEGAASAFDTPLLVKQIAEVLEAIGGETPDERRRDATPGEVAERKREAEEVASVVAGLRARVEEASRTLGAALTSLGEGQPATIAAEAEAAVVHVRRELRDGVASSREQVEAASRELVRVEALHAAVEDQLDDARALLVQTSADRDSQRTHRDRAKGQLEERRELATGLDRAGAEAEFERTQLTLMGLPDSSSAGAPDLKSAQAALDGLDKSLRRAEDDLREARGKLAVVGGALAQERVVEERESLDRLRDTALEIEREYAAARLLQATLKEAEAAHAAHLGACLATPVTERFRALTAGRYTQVSLDPTLKTSSVNVSGEGRPPSVLSVGTREQLATIIRLALAGQLRSTVLLDDQLVQSDAPRLQWFREALRATVREQKHQVVVFTCRAEDYLAANEIPLGSQSQFQCEGGLLVSTNLQHVLNRVG
jgi:DNA repair exonuclease SbcCD ATPase subunit